jgi:hypothetical protein
VIFIQSSIWCYNPEFSVTNQQHPRQPISAGEKNSPVKHKQELQRKFRAAVLEQKKKVHKSQLTGNV